MSNKLRSQHSSPKTNTPRPDNAEQCSGRAPQAGAPEDRGRIHAVIAAPPVLEQTADSSMHPASSDDDGHPPLSADLSRGATSNEGESLVLGFDAAGRRPAKLHCLERPVVDLRPHPLNARIYGDELVPDECLTQSIKEGGVHTPLHVTADNVVIAGHRRLQSARVAGLQTVPVIVVDVDTDEFAAAEYLLETNRARQKTHEQIIREFIEFERIETGRAKARMQAGKAYPVSNLTQGQLEPNTTGRARDIAACKVALSAGTASRGKAVVETIDRLHAAGQAEEAYRLRTILNERSYHAAHKEASQAGWISCPRTKVTVPKTLPPAQVSPAKPLPDRTASVALAQTSEGKSATVDSDLADGEDHVDDGAALVPDQRPFFDNDESAAHEIDNSHVVRDEMLSDKEEVSLSNTSNCIPRAWVEEAIRSVRLSGFCEPDNRILPHQISALIQKIADLVNEMAGRNPDFPFLTWHRGIHTANVKLKAVVEKHQADDPMAADPFTGVR